MTLGVHTGREKGEANRRPARKKSVAKHRGRAGKARMAEAGPKVRKYGSKHPPKLLRNTDYRSDSPKKGPTGVKDGNRDKESTAGHGNSNQKIRKTLRHVKERALLKDASLLAHRRSEYPRKVRTPQEGTRGGKSRRPIVAKWGCD